jgi:hypothetical protein
MLSYIVLRSPRAWADRWTRLNECGYKSLVYRDTPECAGKYFRTCGNLTVDSVPDLVREIEKVQQHVTLQKLMPGVSLL